MNTKIPTEVFSKTDLTYLRQLDNASARKQAKRPRPKAWWFMPLSTPKNIKLKERLANHMNPKGKSESYLTSYYQSGTMSSSANLVSIFCTKLFFNHYRVKTATKLNQFFEFCGLLFVLTTF